VAEPRQPADSKVVVRTQKVLYRTLVSWNVLLQPEGFTAAKQKTVMIGSDRTRFNANNFELAAVLHRFPSRIVTSAYEDDLPSLLSRLYFIEFLVYKDGGEPESRFYNRHQAALLEEVRNGGSFPRDSRRSAASRWRHGPYLPECLITRQPAKLGVHPVWGGRLSPCEFDFGGEVELARLAFERRAESLAVRMR
jgi:hypothetical protein